MSLTIEQKRVRNGMISAAIFSIVFIGLSYRLIPELKIGPDVIDHLVFTIHCDLFALLSLLFGIAAVATQRFFTPSAIGGENLSSNQHIAINVSYIQNSLEQFVLLFIAHLTLATILPTPQLKLIPILVALFLLSRICFWIGYHKNPTYRAFGFAATFYPTAIVIFGCALYLAVK